MASLLLSNVTFSITFLGAPRRRHPLDGIPEGLEGPDVAFAGADRCSRASEFVLNPPCERMLATHHAPRGPLCLLERRHGFAEIVESGAFV